MKDIQLFRLVGKTAVEKIPCWERPDNRLLGRYRAGLSWVKHVKSDDAIIKLLRDSKENNANMDNIKTGPASLPY